MATRRPATTAGLAALLVVAGATAVGCWTDGASDAGESPSDPTSSSTTAADDTAVVRTDLLGEWSVVEVARGDAVEGVVEGTAPVLTVSEAPDLVAVDGTGCNGVGGSWVLDGDVLTFSVVVTTAMLCLEPPGVMDQGTAIHAALESTARAEATPSSLTLFDADDEIVLVAERA